MNSKKEFEAALLEARAKGRQAGEAGDPAESCPYGSYPTRAFQSEWVEGFREGRAARRAAHAKPAAPAVVQEPRILAQGEPLPVAYRKGGACLRCRATHDPYGSVAVVVSQRRGGVVHLSCRLCAARFALPEA